MNPHVSRKNYVSISGLDELSYRKGGKDWTDVNNNMGRISTHGDHFLRTKGNINSSLFGILPKFSPRLSDKIYSTHISEASSRFESAELFIIHSLDHLTQTGNPLWIFYGSKLVRDLSSPFLSNRWVPAEENHNDNDYEEDLDNGKRFYEYSLYTLGGINITGIWVTGKVINFLFSTESFLVNGHYFIGYPITAVSNKNTVLNVPSNKVLSSNGLVFIGSYFDNALISAKISGEMIHSYIPLRKLNKYLHVSSILKLIEWVKGV